MKNKALCLLLFASTPLMAADVTVPGDITANTTWTADNTYIMDKPIFVTNGAVLTIEPGTLILGDENLTNDTFGSLVVTRGSQLIAEGTANAPIVFTAREERDGINGNPAIKPDPALGDASYWGGIVLLGNAQVNNYVGGVNTGEARIEGFPVEANTTNTTYGGGLNPDNTDSSGVLKYVSIRFGGYEFAANNEINGLTLGGVGSGTTIQFVEVVSNSDDGVEFFGGTVNTKNIAVAFCHDESFDIDQGHSGFHQFWFAIQNANSSLGDFGGEWDGGHGSTVTEGPETLVTIYNMTLLGTGSTASGSIDDGINLSDAFAGTLANSVIHDFNGAALSNVGDGVQDPKPIFNNNTWGVFAGGSGIVPNIGGANAVDPAGSNNSAAGTDPQLRGISRVPDGGLDPRPSSGSPLLTDSLAALPAGAPVGFFEQVDYRGAFGESNWLRGWSYLDQQGYLASSDVVVAGDVTTDTTWTADSTYILDKPIFVTNGAVLTIEPGTLILGDENLTNDTFGSLVVTRGSQLIAEGTANAPIVFTAREERDGIDGNPAVKPDPALGDASFWGGIVLLGNAQVNNYVGGVNTGEARIEGFPVEANTTNTTYGGGLTPNNADNSGILKYVSIRFGGYEFAANNEINGLTLGGVGSGTTIQFVEVVSNSDDGVEFFGGTVNTKNIAVAFCHDESFDIDQGHSGFHQFWFAIQNANSSLGDFGGEWDGGHGSTVTEGPETLVTIHNMTLLGTGSTALGSIDDGINLSDAFAGTLANSVIHDFNGAALSNVGDGVQLPKPVFNNNTWGVFAGGSGIVPNIGGPNAVDPAGSNNSAVGTDPQLRGISRIPDGGLDPRPSSGSPLLTDSLAALPAGAPVGFYDTVNYRGAFGTTNWLSGWSYLDQQGYLAPDDLVEPGDVVVAGDITTDTTWTADNTYILDKPIFVTNGAVLTIEPGTLILGDENLTNDTFGSLVVTRGSQLIAEGTANAPIVFTAREERDGIDGNLAIQPDPALGDASFWGGIVILGNAQVNNYVGGVNTGEARIEGFPVEANTTNTTYGGGTNPNNADNSGILKYVSIRFGGYEFAANNEINGLTLGGVGSGTTIEFVEVIANSDDGVEFFGGTVNTKNIAVAFCHDESFDIDQGHSGFHQFWFAIQNANPSLGDFGGEWDGGFGSTVTEGPETLVTIYNMTLLGTGSTAVGSIDDGINLSDAFAGTLANSVIHDFNGVALSNVGDGVQDPKPIFNNNTWGVFAGGAGIVPNIGGANAVDPAGSGNSAVGSDPQLRGISRIPDGGLDPRPASGSPLLNGSLASLPTNAPVGFYQQVNYRGAFGETNWLNGWSYLDRAGYLSDLPDVPSDDLTAPVITLIGANPLNILFGSTFTDPGASVTDNVDAARTITGTGTVDTNQPGSYVITYNAVDAAQNAATTVTRSVVVSQPTPVIPESEVFITSPGSKADIENFFLNEPFTNAIVAVVGKLPSGMKFNTTTKVITGYPKKLPAQATFSVTVLGEPAVDFVIGFVSQPVTTEVLGTHIVQTSEGDEITIKITNKASASVSILKPGVKKKVSAKGTVVFDSEASDPAQQWTLDIPAQSLEISFPELRTLKVEDSSYLGAYGSYEGKPLWGFKSSDSTGTIVLNKAGTNVEITGVISSKGSVSWTITPVGGKKIKAKGSVSSDGICSIYANIPVAGVMAGMLRVDEELDVNDVPTGQLTVSLLQGFEGWTAVSYTAP